MPKLFKMQKFIYFITLLLIIGFQYNANASHSMGADISYVCTGPNTYDFTFSFYRDCNGISAPASVNLSINSPSGCGTSQTVNLTQQSSVEASPLCPSQIVNSTCNGGTLQGVEVYTYTGTVTLSGACTDWIISYSTCCRNSAITNSTTGSMYIETTLNNVDAPCNNSPQFMTPPVPYICANQPFSYNHGTIDPDGDSLVFTLINPKESATLDVTHNAGFSATQPLSTTGAFNFDPNTGQMSFTPNATQIGVVAVLVEEYRNGVLIGSTIRDMQIVVINCTNNTPIPSITSVTGGALNGSAFETCPGNTLNFTISCPDADAGDVVTITNNIAANLPGAVVTVTNGNPAIINVSWLVTTISNQTFTVNFNDGACPVAGQQTLGFVIKDVAVSFPAQDTVKCPEVTTKQLQAIAGGGTYSWSPAGSLSNPNIANPVATILTTPATYTVTYTDPLGCVATNSLTITDHAMNLAFTPDSSNLYYCPGDPAHNLTATLNGDIPIPIPGGYNVNATTFNPISISGGTNVTLSDDDVSGALPIGFTFNFYGTNYTDFHIGSNGFMTFSSGQPSGCCSGQNLPSTTTPNNLIAFAWEDLDPGNGGQPTTNVVRYQTVGTAPNRTLVMEFFNVDHYASGNNVTAQVHLIESTGCIEVHLTTQPDATGNHTLGIEDAGGNNATTVAGHNSSSWTATNEAYEFCPIPAGFMTNYTYNWSPAAGLSSTNTANTSASPASTTTYTCTADDGICTTSRSITIGCTLLPVKCDNFTASIVNKSVALQWTTLSELNNKGFSIERSTDGVQFEEIGWVDGYGTTNVSQNYSLLDEQIANGTNYYYRIKQVDIDNSYQYICNTVHITTEGQFVNSLVVRPNPTKGDAVLSFHATKSNQVDVKVTDLLGRTLLDFGQHNIQVGHNNINIPLDKLSTGVYYIELQNETQGFRQLKKVVKN